jgi:hypothetical protein
MGFWLLPSLSQSQNRPLAVTDAVNQDHSIPRGYLQAWLVYVLHRDIGTLSNGNIRTLVNANGAQ